MVRMELDQAVAERIREVLAEREVSGAELARRLGVTQSYMARRLLGKYPFAVPELVRVAGILDVPVTRFLPDEVAA